MRNTRLLTGFGCLLLFGLGLLAGRVSAQGHEQALEDQLHFAQPRRENHHQYQFISPLLTCIFPESIEFQEYSTLEKTLQQRITDLEEQGQIEKMSYYYRNLDDGRWVGIDEDGKFEPASLFKVPIMIAYYKAAEEHPEVLTERVTYRPQKGASSLIVSDRIKPGDTRTVDELIHLMITESDNVAMSILADRLDYDVFRELFTDLDLAYPGDPSDHVYKISPREYSLFFRVLYNGTYLNHEYSERALALLSKATFEHGLAAGLPPGTTLSHKFGERGLYADNGQVTGYELHDCGIIYNENDNYFLCVFSSGKNLDAVADAIRQVSELSYSEAQRISSEQE